MPQQTLKLKVDGLHCKACEILIEEKILELENVKQVRVSQRKAELEIDYVKIAPDENTIASSLEKIGYRLNKTSKVAEDNCDEANKKRKKWQNIGIAVLITTALVLVLYLSAWTKLADQINPSTMSWTAILIIGLIAGVSTCMALVGGIAVAISSSYAQANPDASRLDKFLPHLYFNLGRIIGFFLLGGLLGQLGSIFKLSLGLSAWMTMLIGLIIIFLGLQILDIFPFLNRISFTLPKGMAKTANLIKANEAKRVLTALAAGPISFFIPCGFTQSMQIYALSTGSFINGAITMSLFAIGTAPGLLSLGGFVSIFKGSKTGVFFKTMGMIIILFGLFNVSNAYQFIKLQASGDTSMVEKNSSKTKKTVQVITMEQSGRGYQPNLLKVELGRPVKWIITSTNPYSCASSLVVPSLKISRQLKQGENIIEFTPIKAGLINFSCSMGMYRGSIEVVDSSL